MWWRCRWGWRWGAALIDSHIFITSPINWGPRATKRSYYCALIRRACFETSEPSLATPTRYTYTHTHTHLFRPGHIHKKGRTVCGPAAEWLLCRLVHFSMSTSVVQTFIIQTLPCWVCRIWSSDNKKKKILSRACPNMFSFLW